MQDLQAAVHRLCEHTRLLLLRDVLLLDIDKESEVVMPGGTKLPPLNLATLIDQHAECSPGYSFLNYANNYFNK